VVACATPEQKKTMIEAYQASGLSAPRFATLHVRGQRTGTSRGSIDSIHTCVCSLCSRVPQIATGSATGAAFNSTVTLAAVAGGRLPARWQLQGLNGHHFWAGINPGCGGFAPCPGFCVWCRVGARADRTRYGNMADHHMHHPRLTTTVGIRIERAII
jgi:hypothetical protein